MRLCSIAISPHHPSPSPISLTFVLYVVQSHCSTSRAHFQAFIVASAHNSICLQRAGRATGVGEGKNQKLGRKQGWGWVGGAKKTTAKKTTKS